MEEALSHDRQSKMNERRRRILSCIAHVVQFDMEEKKARKSSNTTRVANWEWKGVANWEWKGVANWEWTINFKPTGLNSLQSRRQLASNRILFENPKYCNLSTSKKCLVENCSTNTVQLYDTLCHFRDTAPLIELEMSSSGLRFLCDLM
jgi:hypothetical protein